MSKTKKIIVLSCMIALLAVTAIFNFILSNQDLSIDVSASASAANYFTQYRNERLTNRNEEILQLDAIIAQSAENSTEKADALKLKTELTVNTEREMLLETLIKAYGFEDAVIVIGLDSDNVNVIAKSSDLTADDAIAIYTLISEEINVSPENVKIIPIS